MNLQQNEASRRRRLVYHGIRPHLGEETARKAVELCESEFPPSEPFSVRRLLEKAGTTNPEVPKRFGELFTALITLQTKDGDDIGPDPGSPASAAPAPNPVRPTGSIARPPAVIPRPAPVSTPAQPRAMPAIATPKPALSGWGVVFSKLVEQIDTQLIALSPANSGKLRSFLRDAVPKVSLSSVAREEMLRWCGNPKHLVGPGLTPDEMHKLLHQMYLWTLEAVGPVDADKLFGRAIRECERLPEATLFPPRSLL